MREMAGMKKFGLILLIMIFFSGVVVFANAMDYIPSNIAAVKSQRIDGQSVVLEGQIIRCHDDGKMAFRDKTGDISVEISDDAYDGRDIMNVPVQIYGQVCADFYTIKIYVVDIEFL